MLKLYSNSSEAEDHVKNAIIEYTDGCKVCIASAFFSDYKTVLEMLERGCKVEMVVRLNYGTSPVALEQVLGQGNLTVKYYTDESFHPKLYIFGRRAALVGSSNLTRSGVMSNAEMNILITSDHPIFEELCLRFYDYYLGAGVLDKKILADFAAIVASHPGSEQRKAEAEISGKEWAKTPTNINRGAHKDSFDRRKQEFIAEYRAFLSGFDILKSKCEKNAWFQKESKKLPMRLLVDQFLNWIKEEKIKGESYLKMPLKHGSVLEEFIGEMIKEFVKAKFDLEWVSSTYLVLNGILGKKQAVEKITATDIATAISCVNAFAARWRYSSSKEEQTANFINANGIGEIKRVFTYLLHSTEEDYLDRMARCIVGDYKLYDFGESSVKELFGWVNAGEVPLCNDRVLKSMRYLGFNVGV